MNAIRWLNEALESKYSLVESKKDREEFEKYAGKALADKFDTLKAARRITGKESDYYYWKGKPLSELKQFLDSIEYTPTNAQKRGEAKNGAELIYSGNGWKIYKITTVEAAKYYGRDTGWCITGVYEYEDGTDADDWWQSSKSAGVENFYFLIPDNDPKGKWCYLEWKDSVLEDPLFLRVHGDYGTFWDSSNDAYDFYVYNDWEEEDGTRLTGGQYITNHIPGAVLSHLPKFEKYKKCVKEYAEKHQNIYSLTESKADREEFEKYAGKYLAGKFDALKAAHRISGEKSDYYYWINQIKKDTTAGRMDLTDFIHFVEDQPSGEKSRREAKSGATLVYKGNGWRIYKIRSLEAAQYYGKNTKWCISGNHPYNLNSMRVGRGAEGNGAEYYWEECAENAVIYFLIPDNNPAGKWCYLDYGMDEDEVYEEYKDEDILFNSGNWGFTLSEIPSEPAVYNVIPIEVLSRLPGLEEVEYENLEESFFLTEGKEDEKKFADFASQNLADRFNKLKRHNRIKNEGENHYADYEYWEHRPVEELLAFVKNLEDTDSNSEQRRLAKQGAKRIYHGNGWSIYKINTYDACVYYGKGTKWCITGSGNSNGAFYFNQYKDEGVKDYYFLIPDNGSNKWCYLDYGKDDPPYAKAVFFNAEDDGFSSSMMFPIASEVPVDVLRALPGLSGAVEKQLRREDVVQQIRDTGVMYCTEEDLYDDMFMADLGSMVDIKKAIISKDVVFVPDWAFQLVYPATIEFERGSALQAIGEYAFTGAEIESIVLPASLVRIDMGAFAGCRNLRKVSFEPGSKLVRIGDKAFVRCSNLSEVEIPESTQMIGVYAFSDCPALKQLTLGDNVEQVGFGALDGSGVENIYVHGEYRPYIFDRIYQWRPTRDAVLHWVDTEE